MKPPFRAYKGHDPYFVASYSAKDAAMVVPDLHRVKTTGYNIWYNERADSGYEPQEEIAAAIRNAFLFIYFISPRSAVSPSCRNEVRMALGSGKPSLFVYLEETDLKNIIPDIAPKIAPTPVIYRYHDTYWNKLQSSLKDFLNQRPPDPCPPFEEGVKTSELEEVVTSLKIRPGAQALNLMTGTGATAVFLAKKRYHVTAADPSYPNLVAAAELANSHGLSITLKHHGAELPYPDNSFNFICIASQVYTMRDPEAFIREAYRCVRLYGYIMVVDRVIPDDQVEPDLWLNTLERLRDPNFVKFHTPSLWKKWCVNVGLTVSSMVVEPRKQPDLEAYLNLCDPPEENRKKIMEMVIKPPVTARDLFKLIEEEGKFFWQYRRMVMVAGKV